MPESLQDLNLLHLYYFWTVARDGSVTGACRQLGLSQPSVSMQVRKLEQSLGHQLFDRAGRRLVLTETGHMVFDYAEEMFAVGRELLGALRGFASGRMSRLHVGVPMAMPKLITYRLLEPVLHLPEPVQIICREASLEELVADLSRHRFDVILSDTPIAPNVRVRSFNHPLGQCRVAICAVGTLAARYRRRFPASLDGAPMLLPTVDTDMRRSIDRWLQSQPFAPRIVGEFEDSALLKEFGHAGAGLFPVPTAVLSEVKRQYGVELVGRLANVRAAYYAITTDRRLKHPAVVAISQNAGEDLLPEPDEA